ncbi:uncharacterized protein C8Q71DRAFT_757667 [Rhodofomes roseus]|uniref:Uncharacterized protein n=1 Tax=Rhodofomes roseus TaxID=34475 RepID=A0A4Y9Y206_9APHY|nr:uncharacterized protein C8Q71DRAFT_757667 [Rhodofomes roseus]KAH9837313.1 hypothetical protein C8Q71DRAFT_757667 [Rhodofomes roseus]TFY55607.1 hypothetical protein EVJ58_g8138 [Rhodofomes roseus]
MATSLSQLSACVTRILSLTGFPKELKTKDIQAAFADWENVNGGFKIKWINDTSLLIVFNDATAAKRAYLHALAYPPAAFNSPNSTQTAVVKPYDGPDAQEVIKHVNTRQHNGNGRGHNVRNSVSHNRGVSVSQRAGNNNANANGSPRDREPSPTLPNLPSHPTLNALISSSLGSDVTSVDPTVNDPAVVVAMPDHGAPRIGDPGKRMLGAALGVRHPGLPPRVVSNGMAEMQRAMGELIVAE